MSLDVIGPGFGRTGTHALELALEHLGYGPCHYMYEVRDNPELLPGWVAAASDGPVDWDGIFRGSPVADDWPGVRILARTRAPFPEAKAILSIRDPDAWFDSVQATIAPFTAARGSHPSPHVNAIAEMAYRTIVEPIFGDQLLDRSHATRVFREHVAAVQAEIPAGRLLTFDVREGWWPLCAFLGCDVPGMPFPRTNSSRQFVDQEWQQDQAMAGSR